MTKRWFWPLAPWAVFTCQPVEVGEQEDSFSWVFSFLEEGEGSRLPRFMVPNSTAHGIEGSDVSVRCCSFHSCNLSFPLVKLHLCWAKSLLFFLLREPFLLCSRVTTPITLSQRRFLSRKGLSGKKKKCCPVSKSQLQQAHVLRGSEMDASLFLDIVMGLFHPSLYPVFSQ